MKTEAWRYGVATSLSSGSTSYSVCQSDDDHGTNCRIVCRGISREEDARLIAAAPDLLEALRRIMPIPLTGNPSHERLVEFWMEEKSQGRGDADDMLFALAAIAKATQP